MEVELLEVPGGKKERGTMKISGPDHANWRITDLERTRAFYEDVLGLEVSGREKYESGEVPFISVRISPEFTLHLRPDPIPEPGYAGTEDHLALVVEDVTRTQLEEYLASRSVAVEGAGDRALGARGRGPVVYLRDPDGYRIELKIYAAE